MELVKFYSIPMCTDSVIPIDETTIMVHIHGIWRVDRPISMNPIDAAAFIVAAEAMNMQVIPAADMLPPLLMLSEGMN
jgi:hypothetical protein